MGTDKTPETNSRLLANSAIALVIGAILLAFLIWFWRAAIQLTQLTTESVDRFWKAISVLIPALVAYLLSAFVVLFAAFVTALILWRLSGILARNDTYQPAAGILHQAMSAVIVLPIFLMGSPVLVPYGIIKIFKGEIVQLFEQVEKILQTSTDFQSRYLQAEKTSPSKAIGAGKSSSSTSV